MELCFTGISPKKGIPAAKAAGIPFLRGEKFFSPRRGIFQSFKKF